MIEQTPTMTKIHAIMSTMAKNVEIIRNDISPRIYHVSFDILNPKRFNFETHEINQNEPVYKRTTWIINTVKQAEKAVDTFRYFLSDDELERMMDTNSFMFKVNFGQGVSDETRQENAFNYLTYQLERKQWFKECDEQN